MIFSLCDTATPVSRSFYFKVYQVICQRTTVAVFIHDFYLKQYHIGTIRFPSFGTLDETQLNLFRLAGSLQLSTATFFSVFVVSYGLQSARYESNIFEGIQEMLIPFTIAQRLTIQK